MTAPAVVRLPSGRLEALGRQASVVLSEPTAFRIEGPGAVECLQGLVTCDVATPGPDTVSYGALLTAKGMIVADFVILRDAAGFLLLGSPTAHIPALDLLRKLLPPRLARLVDLTGQRTVLWGLGPEVEPVATQAGLPWPTSPGRLIGLPTDAGPSILARPAPSMPWSALVAGPPGAIEAVADRLTRAGAVIGTPSDLEAARILAGWPALGQEIDERTLPQEVRYDELGGVSYTKGCYIGQETVARVHFRGHVNRLLRGLAWTGHQPTGTEVTSGGKTVGRVTSVLALGDRLVGLAILRREIEPGTEVQAGEGPAHVTGLPFEETLATARPRLVTDG